jgi:DNA-binding XRE family transcriptional regulator
MTHTVLHTVHNPVHCLRRVEILGAADGTLGAMTMMDNPTWTLTDRLRKARLLAGLEQADLAERLRVSRNSISNYENGKTEPSATTFVRWAAATGVTLEWLAEGIRVNDKTPAEAGVLEDVRPKGFEPPTF